MNWEEIKKATEAGIKPVSGGFTHATRGVITMDDGKTVFVKIAVDEMTQSWLDREIKAYKWLNEHNYSGAPQMLAYGTDGFALPDMSKCDWSVKWTHDKLQAMFRCLDDLAKLSDAAKDYFTKDDLGKNTWTVHDYQTDNYGWLKTSHPNLYQNIRELLADKPFVKKCTDLAATDPWRGNDLVHFDARFDNFAYNEKDKSGMLVDWNWSCIGNKVFDKTIMLVSVYKSGFDVFSDCPDVIDPASLAWIAGFWLMALYGKNDDSLHDLRTHQAESMLVAVSMLKRLI